MKFLIRSKAFLIPLLSKRGCQGVRRVRGPDATQHQILKNIIPRNPWNLLHLRLLLVITVLLSTITPVHAQTTSPDVYNIVRRMGERELLMGVFGAVGGERNVDAVVREFTARAYTLPEGQILPAEIPIALSSGLQFCNPQPPNAPGTQREALSQFNRCPDVISNIERVAQREMRVRVLAEDLQLIADGYEKPVLGQSDATSNTTLRAAGIDRIWRAGPSTVTKQRPLRATPLIETGTTIAAVGIVSQELSNLVLSNGDRDGLVGAVNRFRFGGVRYVRGERTQFPPPPEASGLDEGGTERQYLSKRWPALEAALLAVWIHVTQTPIEPPLELNETVFIQFSENMQGQLPENIRLWAYLERMDNGPGDPDGDGKEGFVDGDVGLDWVFPEANTPSLCAYNQNGECQSIRGGSYPPPPVQGVALCTHPLARSGYLCKAFSPQAGEDCPSKPDPEPDTIILTACTSSGSIRETVSGPDACAEIAWRDPPAQSVNTQCTVNLGCGNPPSGEDAFTYLKDAQGSISIVIKETPALPSSYLALYQLTLARQQCGLPPGESIYGSQYAPAQGDTPEVRKDKTQRCCLSKSEAYRTQCQAMEGDKVFSGSTLWNGIPFNAETCWQMLTDHACRKAGHDACPETFSFDRFQDSGGVTAVTQMQPFVDAVTAKGMANRPPWMGVSCQESLNTPPAGKMRDPRIDAWIREIEMIGDSVSKYPTVTRYLNTIGANACYFAKANEETLDVPAPEDTALTGGGGMSPVAACLRPDPAYGTLHVTPTKKPWAPPAYRPGQYLQQLDTSFCANLPPESVPDFCAFSVLQGLGQVQSGVVGGPASANARQEERWAAMQDVQEMADALAARIANRLYADYLEQRVSTLARTVTLAADLLTYFTKVKFPTAMCPLGESVKFLQNDLCNQEP